MAMKKRTASMLSAVLLTSVLFSPTVWAEGAQATIVTEPGVQYKTHIQDYGWETTWKSNGALSGTVGESKRLEALLVGLTGSLPAGASIQTYVHVQNRGDLGPFAMGNEAGTSGQGLRLESIRLVLNNMPGYRLLYNVQVQNRGWLKDVNNSDTWFKSGETAGTSGEGLRLEGLRIKIVEVNEEYETYLATLNAVNPYSYTSESWADYQEIVDANVMTKNNSKEEIKQAIANITAAQKDLVLAKNLTAYNAALASVQEVNYTPDTWSVYQDVVAENVVTKDDSQADINTALKNILEAQKKLQWKVNLTEYQATLDAVREEDYTAESWLAYQSVVSSYAMTENNTQPEVDAAVKKIDEAQKKMVKKFDFTAYNALLNAVKEEDYIETTWAIYQDVVDANFVDETYTQSDIEKAIKNIEAAQSKLVKKADLTYYQAVLDAVNKEDYTTVSWSAYQKEVRSVVVNAMSKPEVIDAAVLKILSAQMNLVPAGDMRYYYAAINAVIRTDYTTASWDAYQKVVAANVVIPADGQEAIDAATEKIEAAQKKLEGAAEDLEEYEDLIGLDQDNYTSASWATYQKVIDANFLKPQDGQAKINAAVTKLRAASLKLVERAGDYTEYNKALRYNLYLGKDPDDTTSTKAIVLMAESDYTTSSWATYQKVLDANVMDPDKSQTQVNTAVANIKKAQYKLLRGGNLSRYDTLLTYNIYLGKDPDKTSDTRVLRPMKETEYTAASWAVYAKVLSSNEMDRDKSQAQIDAAIVKIERAQMKLMEKGRLDLPNGYNYILATYAADLSNPVPLKESDFTEKSWSAYQKQISAKGYFVTTDNSQAEIDRAVELVAAAQRNLLKKKGDMTAFIKARDAYIGKEDKYTTSTWNEYLSVLKKYNLISSEDTQAKIDSATNDIINAQGRLKLGADMTAYNEVLSRVQKENYTTASWEAYMKVVSANVRTKDDLQTAVNAAKSAIEAAQLKLIRQNEVELKAFKETLELYQRNIISPGAIEAKATVPTWTYYKSKVEEYASFDGSGNWVPTLISASSAPSDIINATKVIDGAIRLLMPSDATGLDIDAYQLAKATLVNLEGSPDTYVYTSNSYTAYVQFCINNGIPIRNLIEATQGQINTATEMIPIALKMLKTAATGDDIKAFEVEMAHSQALRKIEDQFTANSWKDYAALYTTVSLDPKENDQTEYQNATAAFKAARENLIYKADIVTGQANITSIRLALNVNDNLNTEIKRLMTESIQTKISSGSIPVVFDVNKYTVTFTQKSVAGDASLVTDSSSADYGKIVDKGTSGQATVTIKIKSNDSTDISTVADLVITIAD
ncbi:Ig domain-containing protein [Acetobacterium wieringae]|uniref:Ig domain-containing protein n=1 Tax=Acetobacterium wieringae TaxID=52694 RepID=A0A5D0WN88_9FIRM|nr:Ig domain-containing protein [Acetobacterium wieringae]TYC85785.1 Ig domain-containing protein [Acetobacterium wieringae]